MCTLLEIAVFCMVCVYLAGIHRRFVSTQYLHPIHMYAESVSLTLLLYIVAGAW